MENLCRAGRTEGPCRSAPNRRTPRASAPSARRSAAAGCTATRPFVGPAGHLLDRALADAGVDRDSLCLTNAVKHFKFKLRGTRRIHEKPARSEVVACRPWLVTEFRAVRPRLVLLLGATAAQLLYGTGFRLTQHQGERLDPPEEFAGPRALA